MLITYRENIRSIRRKLAKQTEGRRTGPSRHEDHSVEDVATKKFKKRKNEGYGVKKDEEKLPISGPSKLADELVEDGYTKREADEITRAIVKRHRRVVFSTKAMDRLRVLQH